MDREQLVEAMTAEKCEPPPELRGRDGWHWVQWPSGREVPQFWGGSDDEGCQWHAGTPTLSMRYLSPVLTPSEADALRAARDAAGVVKQSLTTELEKLRRKYKDDMHAALVEVGKWSWRSGSLEAELTTLRAEVEKLRAALKPFADAAPKFRDCGDAIEVADIAHDATFTVGDLRRAATLANAVEVPE